MSRRAVAVGLGALVITTAILVQTQTAHALSSVQIRPAPSDAKPCTVTSSHIYPAGKRAVFTIEGECEITLASYQMFGNGAVADQVLYDSTTEEFSCPSAPASPPLGARTAANSSPSLAHQKRERSASMGLGTNGVRPHAEAPRTSPLSSPPCTHELVVTVPDCSWQVDLAQGKPLEPPNYNTALLAYRFGGEGECLTPSTTTTTTTMPPPTSTPTPTSLPRPPPENPSTSPTVSSPPASTRSATAGTQSTPTELAQSGSHELVLIALSAVGLIGLGRYTEARAKRRRRG